MSIEEKFYIIRVIDFALMRKIRGISGVEQKKRFKLKIKNEEYIIIGTEDSAHMNLVNDLVNDHLTIINEHTPTLTKEQAATLLAINTVSLQVKQQEEIMKLEEELKEAQEKIAQLNELELRLNEISGREREKSKEIIQNNGNLSEKELQNQIEIQKLMNQQVTEKIKIKNQQKNKNK